MPRENRVNIRIGAAHDRIALITRSRGLEPDRPTVPDVYRTLLAEALRARVATCSRNGHAAPTPIGCGHCGEPAPDRPTAGA